MSLDDFIPDEENRMCSPAEVFLLGRLEAMLEGKPAIDIEVRETLGTTVSIIRNSRTDKDDRRLLALTTSEPLDFRGQPALKGSMGFVTKQLLQFISYSEAAVRNQALDCLLRRTAASDDYKAVILQVIAESNLFFTYLPDWLDRLQDPFNEAFEGPEVVRAAEQLGRALFACCTKEMSLPILGRLSRLVDYLDTAVDDAPFGQAIREFGDRLLLPGLVAEIRNTVVESMGASGNDRITVDVTIMHDDLASPARVNIDGYIAPNGCSLFDFSPDDPPEQPSEGAPEDGPYRLPPDELDEYVAEARRASRKLRDETIPLVLKSFLTERGQELSLSGFRVTIGCESFAVSR